MQSPKTGRGALHWERKKNNLTQVVTWARVCAEGGWLIIATWASIRASKKTARFISAPWANAAASE